MGKPTSIIDLALKVSRFKRSLLAFGPLVVPNSPPYHAHEDPDSKGENIRYRRVVPSVRKMAPKAGGRL